MEANGTEKISSGSIIFFWTSPQVWFLYLLALFNNVYNNPFFLCSNYRFMLSIKVFYTGSNFCLYVWISAAQTPGSLFLFTDIQVLAQGPSGVSGASVVQIDHQWKMLPWWSHHVMFRVLRTFACFCSFVWKMAFCYWSSVCGRRP